MDKLYEGGCRCGAVRYRLGGEPYKSGLCHCTECRKETGSSFLYYADWTTNRFSVTGEYKSYEGRSFCPICGGTLFHLSDDHVEIAWDRSMKPLLPWFRKGRVGSNGASPG